MAQGQAAKLTNDLPQDYYASPRNDVLPFLPAKCGRVLDVGCGEGGFGAQLLSAGRAVEVWGIEPHLPSAVLAKERLSRVLHGSLLDCSDVPRHYFDVVTFNDSLEHMTDEREALRVAHELLSDRGVLVCSVPSMRYLENLRSLI